MSVGSAYHVYNRGVAKGDIFVDDTDRTRFLETISFYLDEQRSSKLSVARVGVPFNIADGTEPSERIALLHTYCLMPNHFHLLLSELVPGGVSRLLRRVQLSYTRYYNTRHNRVGPLLQGIFRFVRVESDEQFLHVTRYIHLNPYVARLIDDPEQYQWSSYNQYLQSQSTRLCSPSLALELAGSSEGYRKFFLDFASYARDFELIKKHGFEEEE